jgi:hypothetical protein
VNAANLNAVPYLSLRHARSGRIGDEGQLPPGWCGEQTTDVNVLDVSSSEEKPLLVVNFNFKGDVAGDYIGLSLGQYLPAAKDAVVVLAAEVTMTEWDNVEAAFVVVREWHDGGDFVRQSTRPLALGDAPQIGIVAHQVGGEARVTQPVLIAKRKSGAPGSLTLTFKGLAFGNLYDHPRWLWC